MIVSTISWMSRKDPVSVGKRVIIKTERSFSPWSGIDSPIPFTTTVVDADNYLPGTFSPVPMGYSRDGCMPTSEHMAAINAMKQRGYRFDGLVIEVDDFDKRQAYEGKGFHHLSKYSL